ncbi:MAG: S26 family signal peptidase [Leptolyngbyaceae cyanobacterium RU_5_1]|nr:S26 family signal peptidase [Leptolyngbyaceae cyanobacterium RU_5_1]
MKLVNVAFQMVMLRSGMVRPTFNEWVSATRTVGVGLLIAFGLHTVAEVRYIPSASMAPTLQVGDR